VLNGWAAADRDPCTLHQQINKLSEKQIDMDEKMMKLSKA